jgi:hypothetical protein
MIRKVDSNTFFFLCQSADWQCIITAENEETAASLATENIMKFHCEEYSLSMTITVKKLLNNLIENAADSEVVVFYAPTVLADAGYHNEASELHNFLLAQEEENE